MRKISIVALWVIDRVMQAAAFFAEHRALDDQVSDEQKISELDQVFGEQEVPVVRVHFRLKQVDAALGALEPLIASDDADEIPHEMPTSSQLAAMSICSSSLDGVARIPFRQALWNRRAPGFLDGRESGHRMRDRSMGENHRLKQ